MNMKNCLAIKHFNNHQVRIVRYENKYYFVANDVAKILGYKNVTDALNKHVDSDDLQSLSYKEARKTRLSKLWTKGSYKAKQFVNESGVYALIFGSKLPSARKFKHWVTHDVLPSIRKTGSYSANKHVPVSQLLFEGAKAARWKEQNENKVRYYNNSMRNPGTMTTTVIAKDFGMSATQLNELLEHYGIIYRQGHSWVLYAKYQGMKLGSYASYNYGGNHYVNELWKWNQHGKKFIHDLLNSHGYLLNSEQLNLLNDKSNKNNRKRGYYANKNLHTGHRY